MRAARALRAWSAAAALVALTMTACGSPAPTAVPESTANVVTTRASGMPRPRHVMVVIFENKADQQVVGSPDAPYLSALARSGANYTNSHGIAHPSQPNYIALLSGSTHGVTSDACPQNLGARPNLARQLLDAGLTFVGYAEAMPRQGYAGCSGSGGRYQRKHNPWADLSNIPARDNRTLAQLPADLNDLPTVSFVVPDMCHDMHDCSVATGDRWAKAHLNRYVTWAKRHDSLLIVTFDEDDGTRANHIPTFLVGPMVAPGSKTQRIDHYNVLRTIEEMYRLAPIGLARRAQPLAGAFS